MIIEGTGDYCAITFVKRGRLELDIISSTIFQLKLAIRLVCPALSSAMSTQMELDKRYWYSLNWLIRGLAKVGDSNVTAAGYSRYGYPVYCQLPRHALVKS